MAVVFISPKKRQRMFFAGITATFLVILAFISFLVFMAQPSPVSPEFVFNKPKFNINFNIFDSEEFKGLLPFNEMQRQFVYTAENESGNLEEGVISAVSAQEAKKVLEAMGFEIKTIEEAEAGRENPFTPYYEVSASNFQSFEPEDEDFLLDY
ncbi:MAG: hypothetical protein A2402_01345 [Candidatus Staskawiczbacteria bacterium RIFOXYC1_FULL_37_43]|nr:MAG: hypothetical protein A2813_02840 [Candidatus Staskawiczbacteria bacterium RIFCSPHIGHO2_01_FULL_37_17]OGZ71703.1 MAG: hypothetical protein A2891_00135 [Candidatus Staskawiczbacteria bacterium RIFCSPLOWO2_01_FULL_37_19]OGZ75397.1 MAG: hypothetical protein A2205_01485 [Candidatus Staskawiczbacteria bacterium RIFOXYA1_FULL_37_15]OGZ77994.1 MAG: hypothetical protein A2280_00195 [Candidatus Staskawiczbacteria bacterium RIFOXYA12_FULL_37_10]OGZ80848.1 MAG: hypothetical protein A2353_01250 [Can